MGCCQSKEKTKVVKVETKPVVVLSHSGYITKLKLLSDGRILSSSSTDNRIIMYEYSNGTLKAINAFIGHDEISTPLLEYKDYLLSGDYKGNLLIWNFSTFTLKEKINVNNSSIDKLTLMPDGRILTHFSNDTFKFLDPLNKFVEMPYLKCIVGHAKKIILNNTNNLLGVNCKKDIEFIDSDKDSVVHKLSPKFIMYYFFKKNGNTVIVGLSSISEYDRDSFQLIKTTEVQSCGNLNLFVELKNGNIIAAKPNGECVVFDYEFKLLTTIKPIKEIEENYYCRVLQLNDGSILISDYFGVIRVFDENYQLISKIEASKN